MSALHVRRRAAGLSVLVLSRLAIVGWRSRARTDDGAVAPVEVDAPQEPDVPAAPARRRPRHARRIAMAAFDVALIAALGITLFVGYGIVGNRWYHVVAIEGGSMEPTITRGDLIVVTPAPATVLPGMILVMGIDGRVVTHRVVEVKPDGSLVTKGDANNVVDDWGGKPITVYGQYLFTIPMLGRFLHVSNAVHSGATFRQGLTGGMSVEVGPWATPDPSAAPASTPGATPAPTPDATCDPAVSPDPSPPVDTTLDPCRPDSTPSPEATATPASSPEATATPVPTPDPSPGTDPVAAPPTPPGPADPSQAPTPGADPTPAPGSSPSPAPQPGPSPFAAPAPEAGA